MNTIAVRLAAVRALMAEAGYDALIVPRADEYLGEYIPAHNERMHWMSGFTGSAGAVVVLRDRAAIFTDGRYTVQVRAQVPSELFEYHQLVEEPQAAWLAAQLTSGATIACDPRMHSLNWYRASASTLSEAGMKLAAVTDNVIDRCWHDRPPAVVTPALLLEQRYTGVSSVDKRGSIAKLIAERGADAALIFAPDSVSWLLNVRGTDIPCLPILQSFAILHSNAQMTVFVDPERIPDGFAEHVGEGVQLLPESDAASVLGSYAGRRVMADVDSASAWTQLLLEEGGAVLLAGADPVLLPKACKNSVEIAGAKLAHIRDAVAEVRFLAWLDSEVGAGRLHNEAVLADKLGGFRALGENYHGGSFDTISAAGGNAAMCHYNHQNAAKPGSLKLNTVYLFDSGGQYSEGTTDITRTVAIGEPSEDIKRLFTLVLKGHIALSQARFPEGTTGTQLDILARQFLWQEGFDYDHGTGHGVGAFLSVHEGPQRISKAHNACALQPGMIVSNEPGYYRDDCFGIRCENLVFVREAGSTSVNSAEYALVNKPLSGERSMLEFETLTLVPFDQRLMQLPLLSEPERAWLDAYHERIRLTVGPLLCGSDREWLHRATKPLERVI